MARSIVLALAASALTAAAALAQEPKHPQPAPRDTGMAGMPGMQKKQGAARDTAGRGMPGTTRSGARGRDSARAGRGAKNGMAGMGANHGMPGMGVNHGKGGMPMSMTGPLGIPESRDGSGTAWQPDVTPMYALARLAGRWSLMFHGNAFLQSIHEGSRRGEQQFGSVNWFMGLAQHPLAGGDVALRGMLSLEPLTVGKCGYPDVLATGESCNGQALHDRQHPHDMFMEVAALYQRAVARNLAVELYGGPAGEPALGPVAFPHRISAFWTPLAPISHHWQDATHISFGVVTAGLYGRRWKVEGSAFNGREPDDNRFDFDLGPLDSFSGRVWLLPSDRVAIQVSDGYLREAEQTPEGTRADVHRSTASLTYHRPVGRMGFWANTFVWGQNRAHGLVTNAGLVETSLDLDGRNVIFGRGELDQKSGEDLALEQEAPGLADQVFTVGKLALGYSRQLAAGSLRPALGAELSLNFVPAALKPFYGSTTSAGFAVYASVHPAPMRMGAEHAMAPVPAPMPRGRKGALMAPPDTMHMPPSHP